MNIVGIFILCGMYAAMAFALGSAFISHVTSERQPVLESGYWAIYDYKDGKVLKKRAYVAAIGLGLLWPVFFIYGLIDIARGDK
jgi:hypothetical protein